MKKTYITYCQICERDFKVGEIVYYVPIDNYLACSECAERANTAVEERIVVGEGRPSGNEEN